MVKVRSAQLREYWQEFAWTYMLGLEVEKDSVTSSPDLVGVSVYLAEFVQIGGSASKCRNKLRICRRCVYER